MSYFAACLVPRQIGIEQVVRIDSQVVPSRERDEKATHELCLVPATVIYPDSASAIALDVLRVATCIAVPESSEPTNLRIPE